MIHLIYNYAKLRNILFLFLLILLFDFVLFPAIFPQKSNLSFIDTQFAYKPQKCYEILKTYDKTDIHKYFVGELSVDLVYPIIYSFFLSFCIFLVYKKENMAKFPFLILLLDFLENMGIVTILSFYPQKLLTIALFTSIFSTLKWSMIAISILIIIYGIFRILLKKIPIKL